MCCVITVSLISLTAILVVLNLRKDSVRFTIGEAKTINDSVIVNSSGFHMVVQPTVTTNNDNFFDIRIDEAVLNGKHPLYANGSHMVGYGELRDYTLHHMSFDTVLVSFAMSYKRTWDPEAVFLNSVLHNCSQPTGEGGRELFLELTMTVLYSTFINRGTLTRHQLQSFPCPITPDQAKLYKYLLLFL